jgi:hypothetical protein
VEKRRKQAMLNKMSGAMGVFFPFKTCSYSTEWCWKNCYQKKMEFPSENTKLHTLISFLYKNPVQVANEIAIELKNSCETVLHWFASGDCWHDRRALNFFRSVVHTISDTGIPQCGFTRNKELAWALPEVFVLSFDNKQCMKTYFKNNAKRLFNPERAMRASIPILKNEVVDCGIKLYEVRPDESKKRKVEFWESGGCSTDGYISTRTVIDYFCKTYALKSTKSCRLCFEKSIGCFKKSDKIKNEDFLVYKDLKLSLSDIPTELYQEIIDATKKGLETVLGKRAIVKSIKEL